jgi:hypothetical protein
LLGDAREARHAVAAAQRCYESISPEDAALFYIVNGFGGDLGKCLSGIGDTKQVITFSTMALRGCEPWAVRGLCVTQTDLALTHLLARDLEQAAVFGRDALRTAANLSSTITVERLRTLHRQVHPLRSASPTWPTSTTGSPASSPVPPSDSPTTTPCDQPPSGGAGELVGQAQDVGAHSARSSRLSVMPHARSAAWSRRSLRLGCAR